MAFTYDSTFMKGNNSGDPEQQEERAAAPFPVAAIGASAGGLEALRLFLENLPDDTGIAYVIIQHLSPTHESILPELLERKTRMPVHKVEDRMHLHSNNIYVIPQDSYMSILDGHLTLSPRKNKDGLFLPIDFFFKNLASIYQNKAIGILLSGTGSDGTDGFKEIKAEGGITFAQDSSATFKGMPKNAIDAGFVDFILSPQQIAKELSDLLKLPYTTLSTSEIELAKEAELRRILIILHNKMGVDFSLYKQTTINRRILRRLALNHQKSLEEYTILLRTNQNEVEQLYQDLLINVTTFFRDESVFIDLTKKIFPAIFKDKKDPDRVRIWIAGCATGEEAYSIAISISEYISENGLRGGFQIFATDLSKGAIEKARTGIYRAGSLENVSSDLLHKYFEKTDGHYQVAKSIRDNCVFATHNLLTDPPFSKIDLISCQNVMIYFEPKAQKKILKAFHYALKATGFLILGKSETIGASTDLFGQLNKESKIYTKKVGGNPFDFDFSFPSSPVFKSPAINTDKLNKEKGNETDMEKEIDNLLLSQYVPASVVVNNDLQILRFHGPTSRYLQPPFGKASLNLLKMVREDLVFDLRTLIHKAKKEGIPVKKDGIHLRNNAETLNVEVVPIRASSQDPYFLILFRESEPANVVERKAGGNIENRKIAEDKRIVMLEQELREAKENIRTMGEEFEAATEELQSSNEEVLSSNEELQSMNEELETSREELQSANEELKTINDELYQSNNHLKESLEYREAIVETIREPLIVLNPDLRITSANTAFYQNFYLKQNETEGSFIYELNHGQWNIPGLKEKLSVLISKERSFENFEVSHNFSGFGTRILLFSAARMRYNENKTERILLVIEDITLRRKAEQELQQSVKKNEAILSSISDIFISADNDRKVIFLNEHAQNFVGKKQNSAIGKNLWEVLPRFVNTDFQKHLENAMAKRSFTSFEYYDEQQKKWFHFRIYPSDEIFSIYANNITDEKIAQELLQKSKERYETFISENAEGVWCFELKEPVSINDTVEQQINAFYKCAYVSECNLAFAKMFGHKTPQKMTGATMDHIFSKNELNNESLKTFISSNYHLNDVETTSSNGDQHSYYLHNLVGIIENDHVVRIWGTQRNITLQKSAEMALTKTRNQLNFALAAGSVGTFLWDFSTNKITWTKMQESLYGLKEYSFKGTLEDWFKFIHPDDVAATRKAIEESIGQQKDLSAEFRIYWPDGTLHWILTRATTSFDRKGNTIEMSGVNIDISERKFKEQLIRENEERFRSLVQSSFDVITVFNVDGTVTYQSDSIEKVLGYSQKERLGSNIFDQSIVHPDDREIEKELFRKCIEKPLEHHMSEFRMVHKDGSYRIMEVGCTNLINNSSIHGIIKNYRDITERKMIEKQKEEFIGIASHELKTPVTTIKGYAEILQSMMLEKGDSYSADILSRMDHQIDRLTTLIKDLLDVTRITEGQLQLKKEEFDLIELINEVAEDLQITTKKHEIVKKLEKTKPVKADRERISQVLVNLLSNAIKYSPQADKIIIQTSARENELTISVQDFGIGISNEMQKRLFRRFFRVTDGTVSTFPGLGLGLFIATEIVNTHHGRMWVESAPNEGAKFCFTLPYSS
jgi:two-component system, chemotaxis family, CheB/CheR fusion protein